MTQSTLAGLVLVIITLCQALKTTTFPARYIPLVSIFLGLVGGFYFGGVNWFDAFTGVITGLTASGLYSGYKATVVNA